MPAELKTAVQTYFADSKIRLDGAVETKSGQLYLPLLPPKTATDKTVKPGGAVQLKEKFPAESDAPDLLSFSDGWCFVRVVKKGNLRTIASLNAISESLRKQLSVCKFVPDLIVPDNFSVPRAFKTAVGDLAIAVSIEQAQKPKTVATAPVVPITAEAPTHTHGTAHGAVFVCSPATGKITMLDGTTLEKVTDFPTEGTPAGMALAAGRLYIADQGKSRILVLDPKKRQFLGQINLTPKSAPKGLAALPNGKLIYASESAAGNIDVIETETGKVLLKTKVLAGPSKVAMAPSGNVLIVLNPPSGRPLL